MLILRTYYDDALRSGMTRAQVASALPGILSRINPAGGVTIRESGSETPRAWITAIEDALGPGQSDQARVTAAERAVRLAQQRQWKGR